MLIKQIVEFKLREPGPVSRYMEYSYNWSLSWQSKIS